MRHNLSTPLCGAVIWRGNFPLYKYLFRLTTRGAVRRLIYFGKIKGDKNENIYL
jgi:hypothetical protein